MWKSKLEKSTSKWYIQEVVMTLLFSHYLIEISLLENYLKTTALRPKTHEDLQI